jgi:hypothetical protein
LACHIGEEYRLNVSENRTLRKIFWPEMEDVRIEWIQLFEEEVYDLSNSKKKSFGF